MNDDLVERLQGLARSEHGDFTVGDEAAEEIERLRAELDSVERWFVTGRDAGSVEDQRIECPHDAESKAAHWWNRGYSYTARLFRAYGAERERDALRARIERAPILTATRNGVVRTKPGAFVPGKRVALVVVDE